jgi:hypothetical protein
MSVIRGLPHAALALLAALPFSARASEGSALDGSLSDRSEATRGLMRPRYSPDYGRRYEPDARQGLLLSFGMGGGSLYLSNEGPGRFGAFDVDFRLGYGFSDRFQLFMDFNSDVASNNYGDTVGSWTWTVRGQTVLVGDRAGNGLNVNFGAGFGGITYDTYYRSSSPVGLALAGGLSYDARVTPWFAISPELFVTWHQIPNVPGIADDASSIYGARINFLWYLH